RPGRNSCPPRPRSRRYRRASWNASPAWWSHRSRPGASWTTCTNSARSTSPSTWRVRHPWAYARGFPGYARTRRPPAPAPHTAGGGPASARRVRWCRRRECPREVLPRVQTNRRLSLGGRDQRLQCVECGVEHTEPVVGRPGEGVDGVLGVRHEPDDPAIGAAHARDVTTGTVGVAVDVAEHHAPLALQLVERRGVGPVTTLTRLDRDEDVGALVVPRGPGRGVVLHPDPLIPAHEVQVLVP